jgi:hypothetical protein
MLRFTLAIRHSVRSSATTTVHPAALVRVALLGRVVACDTSYVSSAGVGLSVAIAAARSSGQEGPGGLGPWPPKLGGSYLGSARL